MKILMILSNPFIVDPRVYKEAKSLVNAGHEVTVIVWDRKNRYDSEDIVDGVKVVRIHTKGLMKILLHDLFRNPIWWWKAYRRGLRLYKSGYKFDVIHCHDLDTLYSGVKLKKKLGVKLIYDAHEIFGYMISRDMPMFVARTSSWMEEKLVKYADHVITVSRPLEDYLRSITDKPITIVMNCKDLISEEYQSPKNDVFTISYIGTLNKSRMFPELVDIIGNMRGVRFVIAGKKENLYEEVKERCKKYKNVEFLETIPTTEVIPKTLESNAVICMFNPNDKNSQIALPNKMFEGMITGRPIITTEGLYCSKFIEREKCGISVTYDKEAVRHSIIKLRDNPELCEELGKNGLKVAKKKYNWRRQEKELLKVYSRLENTMRVKICFIGNLSSSFVKSDYEILKNHFSVNVVEPPKSKIGWLKYPFLIAKKMWHCNLSFSWFAGWHSLFPVLISKLFRKKSIVVVGGYDIEDMPEINYGAFTSMKERIPARYVIDNANLLLPFSEYAANRLKILNAKSRFIKVVLSCDSKKFYSEEKKEDIVLTVGAIKWSNVKRKGLENFVRAAKYLPEIKFILIGKWLDNSVDYLKSIATPNVEFMGLLHEEELIRLMQKAKVYCQLSYQEGFGLALAEAMCCKCIPVTTLRGGIKEVVDNIGFYANYDDIEATVEAIKKALKSSEELGRKAREIIKNNFPVRNREYRIIEIIDNNIARSE